MTRRTRTTRTAITSLALTMLAMPACSDGGGSDRADAPTTTTADGTGSEPSDTSPPGGTPDEPGDGLDLDVCDLLTVDEVETQLLATRATPSTEYAITTTPMMIDGAPWVDCDFSYLGNAGLAAETGEADTFRLSVSLLASYDTTPVGPREELTGIGDEAWIESGGLSAVAGDLVVSLVDFPTPRPGVELLRLAVDRLP